MPATAIENVTEAYIRNAEPSITAMGSRAAQAYYLLVDDVVQKPAWLVFDRSTDVARSESNTKSPPAPQAELNTSPTRADATIRQLVKLSKLEADWDGNEAAAPSEASIREARGFLRRLSPESLMPRATLHADGHAILFVRGDDLYAELEFLGNNKIGFFARRGEQKWSDEFSFDGFSLPEGLSKIGFSL